jgi:hypothetical protein
MEIFSFLIIAGLLLSSCTTDENDEEMAVFENDTDPNKWHNKQYLWLMYQEKNKKPVWEHRNNFKEESIQNASFEQTQEPLILERFDSEESQTVYSESEASENLEYEQENAVLQDY